MQPQSDISNRTALPNYSFITDLPDAPKPPKKILLAGVGIIVIAVMALASLAVLRWLTELKLTNYQGSEYSLQIPRNYILEKDGEITELKNPNSESRIFIAKSTLTQLNENVVMRPGISSLDYRSTAVTSYVLGNNVSVTDINTVESAHNSRAISTTTASVKKEGIQDSIIIYRSVDFGDQIYTVLIKTESNDRKLQAKALEILDSFTKANS